MERKISSRPGARVLQMLINVELPHSPNECCCGTTKVLENMVITDIDICRQKIGKNIYINRRESPFKVIKERSSPRDPRISHIIRTEIMLD